MPGSKVVAGRQRVAFPDEAFDRRAVFGAVFLGEANK
jgi:hypothetical protein